MRDFFKAAIVGFGLFVGFFTIPANAGTCVPMEQVANDMQSHGAAVGMLKPELFKKFRAAILHDKTVTGDKSDLAKADTAYGAFPGGDVVVMMFVAKGCVVTALPISGHKLHDILIAIK